MYARLDYPPRTAPVILSDPGCKKPWTYPLRLYSRHPSQFDFQRSFANKSHIVWFSSFSLYLSAARFSLHSLSRTANLPSIPYAAISRLKSPAKCRSLQALKKQIAVFACYSHSLLDVVDAHRFANRTITTKS